MGARARGRLRRATHDPGARSTARSLPVHRAWGYRCYAVLTMCRMLYTLHHGAIVSKPVAARWVEATLDPRWIPLIRDARAWSAAAPPDLTATLELIRHTHARSR